MVSKNNADVLCIDIGGTTIKSAIINNNHLSNYQKNPTPKKRSDFINLVLNLKSNALNQWQIKGIGISTPAIINKTESKIDGISAINYIHDKDFLWDLQQKLDLPITVENDANCAGIAEITQPQLKKYQNIIVVVIGTGIGGCIFLNRKIFKSSNGFAGEFGLMNYGTTKNWGWYASPVHQFNLYNKQNKVNLTGSEIFKKGVIKNKIKLEVIKNLINSWALGIYNIATVLDPDLFVIAGGISQNKNLSKLIKHQLLKYTKDINGFKIEVKNAKFSNHANLIGAYWVFCNVKKFNHKNIGFLEDKFKF